MQLPIKITPDPIRDAIVQVSFISALPFEKIVEVCRHFLGLNSWNYSDRYPNQHEIQIQNGQHSHQHFFLKDKLRVQVLPGFISFNINNEYIGWEIYFSEIKAVLILFDENQIVQEFSRVGIRYINQFINSTIIEKINISVNIYNLTGNQQSSALRFTFEENEIYKTINVADKLPPNLMRSEMGTDNNYISVIDIDIVKTTLSIKKLDELIALINKLHEIEKKTFFNLLKEEFLITLTPQYYGL